MTGWWSWRILAAVALVFFLVAEMFAYYVPRPGELHGSVGVALWIVLLLSLVLMDLRHRP